MKKVFATIIAASLMLAGINANAQVSVGAGYLNSTSTTTISSNSSDSATNGFYVGGDFNLPIVGGLSMAPGLYFSYLTASGTSSIGSIASATGTTTEMYVGIPVNFNYGLEITNGVKGFVYAGPTFNYGLSSSYKIDANVAGISGSKSTDNYDGTNYGRLEILVGGGVGVEVSSFRVTAGYDLGLNNRYTGDADNYTIKRNQLHVGVAYLF